MSQIIKKQIRKTMPVFMIFSLIFSTSVAGLVFNLDFKIVRTVNKHLGLELGMPEAQANTDTADTVVTVRNAAPEIIGNIIESPTSSSTSPINVGEDAYWEVSATDPEVNNFYLIVCETNSVVPHNGAAPTCGGGAGDTFCVSGATVSGGTATCMDASLDDPGAESDDWFGFVCDDHATEAFCSDVNQGAGDSGSPIYINHAPSYTAVITSDNNKNPGGTFTVTASSSDTDVQGGADIIHLAVCSTNNWATSTGCAAATWCTGTSVATDVSCSFATTTPARDGTFAYYAFIKDWHDMGAPVNGRTANYTVNNVAPSVSNVVINGGNPIELAMKGQTNYSASTTADLVDANGCVDITSSPTPATSTIYLSSVAGAYNCADNDNDCYQIAYTSCSYVAGSCTGSGDSSASYICSTSIEHFAIPSDNTGGNPNSGDDWRGGFTAIDDNGLKGSAVSASGVELIGTAALNISEIQIPYGAIRGGQNSGDYNATTTVVNYGNVPLDTQVSGTSMDKSDFTDVIVESRQQYGLNNFVYGGGTYSLSSTTPQVVDTIINRPTNSTDVTDQIYWGIGIPGGTSSGNYSGQNTFIAATDVDGW